ncbi:MAG TPA: insulinase family protein [Sphingomicrobium sp.]|nr:insulinase family protein [Sphingomicrobium sp.]
MKTARFLLAAALFAASAPASAKLDLRRAAVSHLPDGLTVIMLEDHSFPLVSVQMLYKSGSAAEVTGKTGLAHFLEHLAFRGSENFPQARATELIYDGGGEWHGYTAMDQTTYFSTMPRDQLDLLLRIEADRMARVIIDPASIAAEKGAVITELHSYENDPASVLQEAVTRTAIQAHPYGSPMAGYVSDVARLTVADARAYYASHYAPGNAVLAIVGDFDLAQAKTLVAKAFADIPARPVAAPNLTTEPVQRGERRTLLHGAVDKQYFQLDYPAPAASSPDFPAFMVLQEILSGGSGLNLHQTDWAPTTPSARGSLLFGAADDIATWLPPTQEPFLFIIGGSIEPKADPVALERDIERRIAAIREQPIFEARLAAAKAAIDRAISEDVQTTEDAAHQLAFFEGIGALDPLLDMPQVIATVSPADIQRVARRYLAPDQRTIGWMVPGKTPKAPDAAANPRPAADRGGQAPLGQSASQPFLRTLSSGLTAIVQPSPLSDTVSVELLLSAPVAGGAQPEDLPGLGAIIRTGPAHVLAKLVSQAVTAASQPRAAAETPSNDPAARLQQLIARRTGHRTSATAQPLAVIVSGNVEPENAFKILDRQLGTTKAGKLPASADTVSAAPKAVRERIDRPLAQGGIGYVVEGPPPGTREAFAWRMLLYVLTHDYSGRLGNSAIRDKGLVYHIYSVVRTDGRRTWVTISSGVDPDKADAVEAEFRAQLTRRASDPPTPTEVAAARDHLLGRDLTAAQSNEELSAKLAREFVETGGLRSHQQLRAILETITPADLAAIAPSFANGTILRVDVAAHGRALP